MTRRFLLPLFALLEVSVQADWKELDRDLVREVADSVPQAELQRLVAVIQGFGARSPGEAGLQRTGDWLAQEVTNFGFRVLGWQSVPLDLPVDIGSSIAWTGNPGAAVHPVWPNFVVPPVLPTNGLTAPVMYVGDGQLEKFDGREVRGAIVVMDYASEDRWINAASLGAGAVVFLPDPRATRAENMAKWSPIPLQLPRFYIGDGAASSNLLAIAAGNGHATLRGGMRWQRAEARSLIAWLPASQPAPAAETFLINIPYDAASVVPSVAAGGQSAANLAASLLVLKTLSGLPRDHHILVCFDGAHSMNGSGARAFSAVLRDLHAEVAQGPEKPGDDVHVRRLRSRMRQVKPWMDDRMRLLQVRVGRLQAAIDWLQRPETGAFSYEDAIRLPRSPWLPHTDAASWLLEDLADQVKSGQIATLVRMNEAERERPDQFPAWRRKADYYRSLAAGQTLEGTLRALRAADPGAVEWEPEDVTQEHLIARFRARLAEVDAQLKRLAADCALRDRLRDFRIDCAYSIDLSAGNPILTLTRTPRVGGDPENAVQANMEWGFTLGPMLGQRAEFLTQQANHLVEQPAFDFVDSITFDSTRARQAGAAPGFESDQDFTMAGLSPVRLCTGNDPRMYAFGPGDRAPDSEPELKNLQTQARTVALLLSSLLRHPDLWPPAENLRARVLTVGGKAVVRDPRSGPFPRLPVPGTIVAMPDFPATSHDSFLTRYALTGEDGEFEFPDLPGSITPDMNDVSAGGSLKLAAFKLSPESGMLEYALDSAASASRGTSVSVDLSRDEVYRRLVCFRGSAVQFYGTSDPMLLAQPTSVKLLAGKGGSLESWYLSAPDSRAMVAVVPDQSRVKVLTQAAGYGPRMFLLGDQDETFAGAGYEISAGTNFAGTSRMAASALSTLNAARLEKLESKGVRSSLAGRLHRQAVESLVEMKAAVSSNQWALAQFLSRDAWGRELRAYPVIVDMANEAVLAAVLLLAFMAVSAVFLERLILQSGSINGRIGGGVLIFSVEFMLLYFLHPAFQISSTPIIILVAYLIVVLAILAFGVVSGKYNEVMKEWRERTGGIHASDISRAGALGVAFNLGLTNLAKRPLRTGLIILTVALLSFSVMTFTSVETSMDTRFVPVSESTNTVSDTVLFRLYKWAAIDGGMARSFERDLGPGSEVARRLLKLNARNPWAIGLGMNRFVLSNPSRGKQFTAEALMGFMPTESRFSRLPSCVAGRWFSGRADEIILPTAAAAALGIGGADVADEARLPMIQYGELWLRVVGILDTARADALRDCSNEPLAPADFYRSGLYIAPGETDLRNAAGSETGVSFMTFDRTALLPYGLAGDLGSDLYNIVARFGPGLETRSSLQHLMSRLEVNLFAGMDGRAYLVKTARSQSVQGAWKLLMPVLLVVLIMVNVMMGTVDERKSEIKMLGAVGLAPRHVSILFLAEASVYGVLGVVFGLLTGLVVGRLTRGLSAGLDVNYASVSTMGMGMLVLGIVVLATWIPARRAARLATPSGAEKWSLPATAEGHVAITLPFHVTRENGLGVFGFLHEYLGGHRESTSPDFRCTELSAAIVPDGPHSSAVEISGQVWPAPYDRRVSQDTKFRLSPVEGTGMFSVQVSCGRLSGELDAWNQGVFEFLDLVRRQFLIYRTLSDENKDRYVASARNILS